MIAMTASALKQLREELQPKVSQETLARHANVTLATLRNAEKGKPVFYSTAKAICDALNELRQKQGLPGDVTVEQLGLPLR